MSTNTNPTIVWKKHWANPGDHLANLSTIAFDSNKGDIARLIMWDGATNKLVMTAGLPRVGVPSSQAVFETYPGPKIQIGGHGQFQFALPSVSSVTSTKVDNLAESQLIRKVEELGKLEEGWDGYGGTPPSRSTLSDAIALIKKLPTGTLPSRVGASGDGEISLIWETDTLFADFGVIGDGKYCFFINREGNKLYGDDCDLTDELPELAVDAILG